MNRKFFVLAFVSAAFFLGCSADGFFQDRDPETVIWSKVCYSKDYDFCENLSYDFTAEDCEDIDGKVQDSCPKSK